MVSPLSFICLCFGIIALYGYQTWNYETKTESHIDLQNKELTAYLPLNPKIKLKATANPDKKSVEKLVSLAKLIYNANKHVRGTKTSDYLKKAISCMNNILRGINEDPRKVYERRSVKSIHICPEHYKGGLYGFPMYYEGFVTEKCSYGVSVSELVTVVKYIVYKSDKNTLIDKLEGFIASIKRVMNNCRILLAVDGQTVPEDLKTMYEEVSITSTQGKSEGDALNTLVKKVKTPYVLVARRIDTFTNDSRLERMVREIESLNVTAVGGSFREPNGHWKIGCFQSVYKNYTLKYVEGYDESFHECLFCDYIQGPFITHADYMAQNKFKRIDEDNGLYEDWFLRIARSGLETIVCPDSMFYVDYPGANSVPNWQTFTKYWNLFKVISSNGKIITRSCRNVKIGIKATRILSPCAMKVYNEGVKFIMKKCEETGVICELQEGSVLGAVKLGQTIPWDLDYDLRFSFTNCSNCQKLEKEFKRAGMKIRHFSRKCCTEKYKQNNFPILYKGTYGDFSGHQVMDSQLLVQSGISSTKVLFNGQWVNAARNPGLFVRNRYGRETYRHCDHWRHSGHKNPRPNYTTNVFMPCTDPGAHNCLDRYNADGNLLFTIMLP